MNLAQGTLNELLATMANDELAPEANVVQLADELATHHNEPAFRDRKSMGALLRLHLQVCLSGDDVRLPVAG